MVLAELLECQHIALTVLVEVRAEVCAACLEATSLQAETTDETVDVCAGEVILLSAVNSWYRTDRVHERLNLHEVGDNLVVDGVTRCDAHGHLAEGIRERNVAPVLDKLPVGCGTHGDSLAIHLAERRGLCGVGHDIVKV